MTTINIAQIITTADTQFRVDALCEDNIEAMMDLIERNVPFKTKMRLARWNDSLYLVDGFHRIEAYVRSKQMELSLDLFAIVEANSIEEIRVLAAGANVAHGKGNTQEDFHYIIKRMMEFGDTYMEDTFTPDIEKIANAIGAAKPKVQKGFSSVAVNGITISQACKEKKDSAIMELHKKGMKAPAIAKALSLKERNVYNRIAEICKIANSADLQESEDSTPAPHVVPQANTQPRPDTQVDAAPWFDERLAELGIDLDADYGWAENDDEVEEGAVYDVLARTGFKADDARNNRKAAPSNGSECTPELDETDLHAKRAYHLAEVAKIDALLASLSEGIKQAA